MDGEAPSLEEGPPVEASRLRFAGEEGYFGSVYCRIAVSVEPVKWAEVVRIPRSARGSFGGL